MIYLGRWSWKHKHNAHIKTICKPNMVRFRPQRLSLSQQIAAAVQCKNLTNRSWYIYTFGGFNQHGKIGRECQKFYSCLHNWYLKRETFRSWFKQLNLNKIFLWVANIKSALFTVCNYITWLDATLDDLLTRTLCQIPLSFETIAYRFKNYKLFNDTHRKKPAL